MSGLANKFSLIVVGHPPEVGRVLDQKIVIFIYYSARNNW